MKKEFAHKWADALESGKFSQTKGTLFDGEGYCCLGVACVLAGKKFESDDGGHFYFIKGDSTSAVLPEDVMEEIGMNNPSGHIQGKKNPFAKAGDVSDFELTTINDEGVSFKEIAKIIRKYYKGL